MALSELQTCCSSCCVWFYIYTVGIIDIAFVMVPSSAPPPLSCCCPCPTPPLLLLPPHPLAQRVMEQEEDSALLKAYIAEWSKYFTQCSFLPMPFQALETAAGATKFHKKTTEGNRVYTVSAADCKRSYLCTVRSDEREVLLRVCRELHSLVNVTCFCDWMW